MEEKKYTKTKLFLFFVFAIFLVIFFVSSVKMIKEMFFHIEAKNNELKCNTFKFEVSSEKLNSNYILSITNNYNINITKLTIINNMEEIVIELEPIFQGETRLIKINFTLNNAYAYPNDCINKKIKIK